MDTDSDTDSEMYFKEDITRRIDPIVFKNVPDFPNYTLDTVGYPERYISRKPEHKAKDILLLGPPLSMYFARVPLSHTIFVSSLHKSLKMEVLVKHFEKHGSICSIELGLENKTWNQMTKNYTCAGFAWITFVEEKSAMNAFQDHLLPLDYDDGLPRPMSIYKSTLRDIVLVDGVKKGIPKQSVVDKIFDFNGVKHAWMYRKEEQDSIKIEFKCTENALFFLDVWSRAGGSYLGIPFEKLTIPDFGIGICGGKYWNDQVHILQKFQPLGKSS